MPPDPCPARKVIAYVCIEEGCEWNTDGYAPEDEADAADRHEEQTGHAVMSGIVEAGDDRHPCE